VASVPFLVAAGALASTGGISLGLAVVAVVAGGFLADLAWFAVGRYRGDSVLDLACGLSARPDACVLKVSDRISGMGAPYIVIGKFIPGIAALLATAAGLSEIGRVRFVVVDALALTLWALTYTVLGWFFSDALLPVIDWITTHLGIVGAVILGGIVLGALGRVMKIRKHVALHGVRGE